VEKNLKKNTAHTQVWSDCRRSALMLCFAAVRTRSSRAREPCKRIFFLEKNLNGGAAR
jgi:hypothetical protein